MHRFFLPPSESSDDLLTLREGDAHHARHVLRLRPGDEVTVLDGAGAEYRCVVEGESRTVVCLKKFAMRRHPPLPWQVTLYPAVTKAKSMDWVMQKATELGVARILPVFTERSVPQFGSEEARGKTARWRDLAIEAVKQCGNPWLPRIEEPERLGPALARAEAVDLALVGSLRPARRHPRAVIEQYRAECGRNPATVTVWIGPEGDFTPAELDAVEAAGVQPFTLGPLVLRAETAALYCLAFLGYELGAGLAAQASSDH